MIAEADTVVTTFEPDEFDKLQHNTYYFVANSPSVAGDNSTCYTSIKHVKVRWPLKVNGSEELESLNKELIGKAFGNSHSSLKDARYVYLNKPAFNKPMGDDYRSLTKAPVIVPVYGNVSQVLVYPYMTSNRLLVMEVDKVEYNGHATIEDDYFIHYDRVRHRVLSRIDILSVDVANENKLLKLINKKIDDLNRSRGDSNHLQHALNVPAELCCGKDGILFQFRQGSISSSPIKVQIDYEDVKPFLTDGFAQLLDGNAEYELFKDHLKPEPVNASPTPAAATAVSAPQPEKKKSTSSNAYSGGYKKSRYNNGYYKKNRYYNKGNNYNQNDSSGSTGYKRSYKKSYKRGYKRGYKRNGYSNGKSSSGISGYKQQSVKQGYKSQKHYSGATRRAGRYGRSATRR